MIGVTMLLAVHYAANRLSKVRLPWLALLLGLLPLCLQAEEVSPPVSGLLDMEQTRNEELQQRLDELAGQREQILAHNRELEQRLGEARRTAGRIDRQIEQLQGSLLLSRLLYRELRNLPPPPAITRLAATLDALRLERLEISRQLDELEDPPEQARARLPDGPEAARQTLARLLAERVTLLQRQEAHLDEVLELLTEAELGQQQLRDVHRRARETIEEKLFWMPSTPPLDGRWFGELPAALYQQLTSLDPAPALEGLAAPGWRSLFHGGLPVVLAMLLLYYRPRMRQRLDLLHREAGEPEQGAAAHTPLAILLDILLKLPAPLVLAGLALALRPGAEGPVLPLSSALLQLALLWLIIRTGRRLLRPRGTVQTHFLWSGETVRQLRNLLGMIGIVLAPLVLVMSFGDRPPEQLAEDRLGPLIILTASLLFAWLLARAALRWPTLRPGGLLRLATVLTLVLLAVAPALLTALGYYYTALQVGDLLLYSFYLLLAWILVSATAVRALTVASRHLAWRREKELGAAREKAALAEAREGAEAVEAVEQPPLEMSQVSAQSLRLTHTVLVLGFVVALYALWSDVFAAFAYLDTISLWEQRLVEGDQVLVSTTSVADLLWSLVILALAITLARNLPGLLEITVLSRLSLQPGSAYAITSLLAYVLVGTGLILALGALGVAWSKLQWLVAALGLGLGFGLQEIFANFISGLIVLFEKPIRIGDVITIGDLSGTVTRIRIRATTITDFDRKEIIVPNKSFVTDRLVNWSLTDSVTRLVLKVGFAYGSDLSAAREILLQAATENERVLQEPTPTAYFLGFGASTLDHELRAHVGQLSDRLPATDEILRRIDELCRERGVEIAFSQLDIHIRSDFRER